MLRKAVILTSLLLLPPCSQISDTRAQTRQLEYDAGHAAVTTWTQRLLTVLDTHYPQFQEMDLVTWAQRTLTLDLVRLSVAEATLEMVVADNRCAETFDDRDPKFEDCVRQHTRPRPTLELFGIDEGCPESMVAVERYSCLLLVSTELDGRILSLFWHLKPCWAEPFASELAEAYEANGKPPAYQWHKIPAAMELAQADALHMFTKFAHLVTIAEVAKLEDRISREASTALPRYVGRLQSVKRLLSIALRSANNVTYAGGCPGGGFRNADLNHWLNWTRNGVAIPVGNTADSSGKNTIQDKAAEYLSAQEALTTITVEDSVNAWRSKIPPRPSPIWVQDGEPIILPRDSFLGPPAETPQPVTPGPESPTEDPRIGTSANTPQPVTPRPEPPTEDPGTDPPARVAGCVPREGLSPSMLLKLAADGSLCEVLRDRRISLKIAEGLFAISYIAARSLDLVGRDLATWKLVVVNDYAKAVRKASLIVPVSDFVAAKNDGDVVGMGLAGVDALTSIYLGFMMKASGLRDRIERDMRASVDRFYRDYNSPFPPAYIQQRQQTPRGRIEPALPSEIMNLERRKREYEEDRLYKTPCSRSVDFLFGSCG